MAEVSVNKKENFEKALRKFKTQCKREEIVKKYRERQYYKKPSQKRRDKARKKR